MTTLTKHPAESRTYQFDFTDVYEIATNSETITGTPAVAASPAGLTLGTPTVATGSKKVNVRISAGADRTVYVVTCTVATTGGATLQGCGTLVVESC